MSQILKDFEPKAATLTTVINLHYLLFIEALRTLHLWAFYPLPQECFYSQCLVSTHAVLWRRTSWWEYSYSLAAYASSFRELWNLLPETQYETTHTPSTTNLSAVSNDFLVWSDSLSIICGFEHQLRTEYEYLPPFNLYQRFKANIKCFTGSLYPRIRHY